MTNLTTKQTDKSVKVYLACNHSGCPRKMRTKLQGHEPKGTVLIRSVCPWHADGDFDTETYFDKDGKELLFNQEEAV